MPPQCVANAFNTSHTCRVCHYPLPAGARPNFSAFGAYAEFRRRRRRPLGARLAALAPPESQALDAAELSLCSREQPRIQAEQCLLHFWHFYTFPRRTHSNSSNSCVVFVLSPIRVLNRSVSSASRLIDFFRENTKALFDFRQLLFIINYKLVLNYGIDIFF
jgi:hypothetical protein